MGLIIYFFNNTKQRATNCFTEQFVQQSQRLKKGEQKNYILNLKIKQKVRKSLTKEFCPSRWPDLISERIYSILNELLVLIMIIKKNNKDNIRCFV
ncbi:hypothetical protein pb186bvf_021040 [Paramecium bursaria]